MTVSRSTIALLVAMLLIALTDQAVEAAPKPNIVYIMADELGYYELSCLGHPHIQTPSIDRMAREGMRFTQAYAAAPVCSPYRAAFLTGQYPARVGIVDYLRPNSANALSTRHVGGYCVCGHRTAPRRLPCG